MEFQLDSILYINCVCAKSFSSIWLCVTLWTGTRQVPLSNSGVDSHALLQGIFPTQGSLISKHMLWKLMKYEYVLGGKLSILWYLSNTLQGWFNWEKKNPQVLQAKCGWNTRRVREGLQFTSPGGILHSKLKLKPLQTLCCGCGGQQLGRPSVNPNSGKVLLFHQNEQSYQSFFS